VGGTSYFVGIDVGASTTKAIIIDQEKKILGHSVNDSGADFQAAAGRAFENSKDEAGLTDSSEFFAISTGYGRRNVPFAGSVKTEISCHAKGSFHDFPHAHTLIDIGGQDSKIIRIDGTGKRIGFKMNRKCAAGTGAFLEEIANRLKIPIGELNGLAESAAEEVQLGSYCTVFTATEILTKIREGVKVADLVKGIFGAVIKRALEMSTLEGNIVMSGGVVAHNSFLVEMFSEKLGKEIFVPPLPQFTGAFGAALFALMEEGDRDA
jgi:predicted CoA-substrate-specific enzyme activase